METVASAARSRKNRLAQSLGQPSLIALAATILARRERYYAALERRTKTTKSPNGSPGCRHDNRSAAAHPCAYRIPHRQDELLDRIRGELNERQEKALLRMFKEGPEGFEGGMSASKYSTITGASPATTTRDLADLTEKDALIREGERRHARYKLNVPLRHVPHISVGERGELIEE